MNDITLKQIEIFITVAESLSFSEAARELFIDPSVVSRWIQRLESNLETSLFIRHNKGIALTPDGEFLYGVMKPAFTKLNNSVSIIRGKNKPDRYVIKIGCLYGDEIISSFEERAFQFRKLYPNVQIEIAMYSFDELRREFVDENIDFAVSYYMGFGAYGDMQYRILKEMPSFLVLSKDSPAIKGDRLHVEKLNDETLFLIAPAEISTAENYILSLCRELGFQPKQIKYLPNILSIEIAIKDNKGFTIGSDILGEFFTKELRLFRIPGTKLSESIAIFWHENTLQNISKRFIEALVML